VRAILAAAGVWLLVTVSFAHQRPVFPGTLDQHPSIDYRGGAVSDVATNLLRDVNDGRTKLTFAGTQGFLLSLLDKLGVPVESQILLFSKTGIQHPFTSPERPRALYFNDRVVVGYIPGAPFIELASHDPRQGVVFQSVTQNPVVPLQTARPDRCTTCHLSGNTMFVPGILVRSNFTAADGRTMPALVIGCVSVGECDSADPIALGSAVTVFARPKSSTFTVPFDRSLMFAGFKSRWMIPCSCAASSASAICFAIGNASSIGIGPLPIRSASVGPSTSSITSAVVSALFSRP